jgi:hypothetical protein
VPHSRRQGLQAGRPVLIETLLQVHLIRDRLHAADSARYPHRAIDIVARAHEAAQLNDALERLNLMLQVS